MDRIWESGAAGAPPSPPASPSSGYPTAGNPATGTPATKPGPWLYHMLVEEMRGVIAAAGITPDHTDVTQLLAALRSAGVFRTAVKFDNTTKAATTAFVQQALGNFSTFLPYAAGPIALTAAQAGAEINYYGNSAATATLPLASTVPVGCAFWINNTGTNTLTVTTSGTDIFTAAGGLNSLPVGANDNLFVVSVGAGGWTVFGGSSQLKYTGSFAASFGANGYQKLPSGLIVQWGIIAIGSTAAGATTSATVTYPIAFPNGAFAITANVSVATIGTEFFTASANKSSASQALVKCRNSFGGSASTASVDWIAIGN